MPPAGFYDIIAFFTTEEFLDFIDFARGLYNDQFFSHISFFSRQFALF